MRLVPHPGDRNGRNNFSHSTFFLFYVFWEVMLLPMYFPDWRVGRAAPGIRCHQVLPVHASGSVFILIALLAFYFTNIQDVVNSPKPRTLLTSILLQKAGRQAANVCTTKPDNPLEQAQKQLAAATGDQKAQAEKMVDRWSQILEALVSDHDVLCCWLVALPLRSGLPFIPGCPTLTWRRPTPSA